MRFKLDQFFLRQQMRRFFRFSTRDLLILLAAVGLLLAVLSPGWHRARQERRRLEATARLIEAAKAGDAEAAKRALRDGAEIDVSEFEFQTGQEVGFQVPLRCAIEGGHLNVLKILVDAGCDPSHPMHLSHAAQCNRPEIVTWLLTAGKGEGIEVAAEKAAGHGHVECLRHLLAAGARGNLTKVVSESKLPRPQKLAVLKCLLNHRSAARKGDYDDSDELAKALDHAVREVDAELGDLLCAGGAKYTLREAITFDRLDDVRQMLAEDPASLQARLRPEYGGITAGYEPTPLGIALRLARRAIALELIERGARMDRIEYYEETMLHMAARGGDAELINMVLARGFDVNANSDSGTPISIAVCLEREAAVQSLLDAGAEVNVGTYRAPIHSAVGHKSPAILRKLIEAGADLSIRYPTVDSSVHEETVREFAARLGHTAAVQIIDEALKKQKPAKQVAPDTDPPE